MNRWTIPCAAILGVAFGCQLCEPVQPPAPPAPVPPASTRAGIIPITPAGASIEFTGSTPLKSQSGHFAAFDGTLEMPTDDPKDAELRVAIDMTSATTSIGLLTRHLKGEDFFDVAKYPKADFVSEAVSPTNEPGNYRVAGTLDFHGVRKRIEFPARFTVTPDEVTLAATLTIRQTEFGMSESARKTTDEVPVRVAVRGRRR